MAMAMAMASSISSSRGAATSARGQARAILDEARFHSSPVPHPLHGLLHAVGTALESPLRVLEELVSSLGSLAPGGTTTVWAILAAVVLALSALLATRGARRALREPHAGIAGAGTGPPLRASDLERDAAAAEARGRNAEAVRLRFRAGLMRLAERELIEAAPSTLNVEVSRTLRSERFDRLARSFEEIAYGGREAQAEDVAAARSEWSQLLGSGGRT
jgi:Domain of unknown function (DUF4129)